MNSEQFENTSSAFDHELNEALVNANIENGYEEFLAIFDRFYSEQVEVVGDGEVWQRFAGKWATSQLAAWARTCGRAKP
jgi:hypothetical protein